MSRREQERAPTVRLARGGLQPLAERAKPTDGAKHQLVVTPILALDLGTRTGWAVRWDSKHVASGVESFEPRRGESAGMRLLRFRRWFRDMLSLTQAALVAYEEPAFHPDPRRPNVSVAHNLEGVLLAEVEGRHDYVSPTPAEVKRHVTGRGNASKAEVMAAARQRWGKDQVDEDEADALCLLAWVLDAIGE